MTSGNDLPGAACGNKSMARRFSGPNRRIQILRDLLLLRRAESFNRAQGDRHGQGSDAQQQGKEETEGRQEPQKGRRRAGQSVRGGQDPGRPESEQQEELTLSV